MLVYVALKKDGKLKICLFPILCKTSAHMTVWNIKLTEKIIYFFHITDNTLRNYSPGDVSISPTVKVRDLRYQGKNAFIHMLTK